MKKIVYGVIILTAMAVGVTAGHLYREWQKPNPDTLQLQGTLFERPRPLPDFTLIDYDGQEFGKSKFQGAWTLVFYGFTNCPDVCPTTLATISRTIKLLNDAQASTLPEVLFISVDPMRDKPEKIKAYTKYFHENFKGATGDTANLLQIAQAMSVAYNYVPVDDGRDYTVDHSSTILLINPRAELTAVFTAPHKADSLAKDYLSITTLLE
ncbi:MAG: SCO family protein [Gammaproteobacteria bacterium]|nr:SCO family protein [Gammaproteobacteria bacterium]